MYEEFSEETLADTSYQGATVLKKRNDLKLSWPHNSSSSCRPVSQMEMPPKEAVKCPCLLLHMANLLLRMSLSETVIKMVNICPAKKQEFAYVSLAYME